MMKLALFGGEKIRTKPLASRPHIDELERKYVNHCLDEKYFSRFIGSPVGQFRKQFSMTSEELGRIEDFWSVVGGPYVRKFEAEFACKHGVKYAVCSNAATSSITSALIATGIKPGDEVITTPFTFTASATALRIAGAKVVFADIDPDTYCVTLETVKARVTARTKAIMPVHLLGNAGDVVRIAEFCQERGLVLIEDSAQAIHSKKNGRYLGTFGAVGCFSFQESKNIMTGEGGMAITNDPKIAYKLRLIRNHGEAMVFDGIDSADIIEAAVGYNFRLPEPLAALGFAQTQKLEMLQDIRRKNFAYLSERLRQFEFLRLLRTTNDPGEFAPYCVGMRFSAPGIHRNTFAEALRAEGIPVATGFPRLLNENPYTREDVSLTPTAKSVNEETYLGFFQVGHPNGLSDMDDIIAALAKLKENFDALRAHDADYRKKREYVLGR